MKAVPEMDGNEGFPTIGVAAELCAAPWTLLEREVLWHVDFKANTF